MKDVSIPHHPRSANMTGNPPSADVLKNGDDTGSPKRKAENIPISQGILPQKGRGVSAVVQPANRAVITISDEGDRQKVEAFYRRQYPGEMVVTLTSPDDLENHHLLQTATCPKEGEVTLGEGRLYSGQPLTLIVDLTAMTPGQIARMNDLLEEPATCGDERNVSSSVRLVALITTTMYSPGLGRPEPDCWRRLQRFPCWVKTEKLVKDDPDLGKVVGDKQLLSDRITDYRGLSDSPSGHQTCNAMQTGTEALSVSDPVVADFATGQSWHSVLFGGLALNEAGRIYFQPGVLANLHSHGVMILQDAPEANPEFNRALADVLRVGGYEANGCWITIPPTTRFYCRKTSKEEIELLKKRLVNDRRTDISQKPVVVLNSEIFHNVFSGTRLSEGVPLAADTFADFLTDCRELHITGSLSKHQWLTLLQSLEALQDKLPPSFKVINIDHFLPAEAGFDFKSSGSPSAVTCQLYENKATALDGLSGGYTYQLTAQDCWENLWYETRLESQNNYRFAQKETQLLQKLKEGTPVILHGLEDNPAIRACLESLLVNPPYLFVHGHKILLPEARVTILIPQKKQQAFDGLWTKQKMLSSTPSALDRIFHLFESLPKYQQKNIPDAPPWQSLDFPRLLARQVAQEQQRDGASETLQVHYRQALNLLVARPYRDDPLIYGYLKAQIQRLYPDSFLASSPEQSLQNYADRKALLAWLRGNPLVNREMVVKDFWALVRFCPVADLDFPLPATFESPGENAVSYLCRYLVGSVPKENQNELARQLRVDLAETESCCYFDSARRTRLRDALLLTPAVCQMPVSELLQTLEPAITQIIEENDPADAVSETEVLLTAVFTEDLLKGDFADLPAALVYGSAGRRVRQQARLKKTGRAGDSSPPRFPAGAGRGWKKLYGQRCVPNPQADTGLGDVASPHCLEPWPQVNSREPFWPATADRND